MGRYHDYFQRAVERFDKPGPEIKVEPFAPGTVTPAAGIVKSITSLIASRRAQANFEQEQALKAADRAEQSRYRTAQTTEAEQRIAGTTPVTKYQQSEIDARAADDKRGDATVKETARYHDMQDARSRDRNDRMGRTQGSRSRYSAARTGLDQLRKEREDFVSAQVLHAQQIADSATPEQLGVPPEADATLPGYGAVLQKARESYLARVKAAWERRFDQRNAARYQQFLRTIEAEGATGAAPEAAPDETGWEQFQQNVLGVTQGY